MIGYNFLAAVNLIGNNAKKFKELENRHQINWMSAYCLKESIIYRDQ